MHDKICFFDTECNSLDTLGGYIQEIAWAVYDIRSKRLLDAKSRLVSWGMQYEVESGAYETTGLGRDFCELHGKAARHVFEEFITDVSRIKYLGGHNILGFDLNMLRSNVKRAMFSDLYLPNEPMFIDTMIDCPYPANQKYFSLKYLAFDHGYVMSNAHQALADVFACAHVFFSYPFEECIKIASTPVVLLSAYTDYFDTDSRDKLHQKKFKWNREKKRWEKRTRAYFVPGAQLDLKVDLFQDEVKIIKEEAVPKDPQEELPF